MELVYRLSTTVADTANNQQVEVGGPSWECN